MRNYLYTVARLWSRLMTRPKSTLLTSTVVPLGSLFTSAVRIESDVRFRTTLIDFVCAVDASQAGAGNLEIIVSVNGRHVPNYVQSEGNAKFRVSFKPQEPLPHTLSVRFNGEAVPGEYRHHHFFFF